MYELGKRSKHRQRAFGIVAGAIFVMLVAAGAVSTKHFLKPHTSLTQSPAAVRVVKTGEASTQTITELTFSLNLPKSWKALPAPKTVYHIYSWRGAAPDDSARSLDIYVDTIPATLAVNRLMPVQAAGDHLTILNAVSDNCANFTNGSAPLAAQGVTRAKWSGVDFLCDEANSSRNVAGTGSVDAVNDVTLAGSHGTHHYFFTYTDNSGQPNYSIFTAALQSFKAL